MGLRDIFKRKALEKAVTDVVDNDAANATGSFDEIFQRAQRNARQLSVKEHYLKVAPIRNAITKIADNAARARFRMFDRVTGNEIIGGELHNLINKPSRFWSEYQLKQAIYSWYLLAGEYAVFMPTGDSYDQDIMGKPTSLVVLDPFRLRVEQPANPNDISYVIQWQYNFPNGAQLLASSTNMLYGRNFALGGVRGISPILSGSNEIASYYYGWDHAASFFENHTMPSAIINMPETMSPQSLKAMRNQYEVLFGGKGKHGVLFAQGQYEIKKLDTSLKDSLADKMIEMSEQDIYKLYSVPPIISGDWNNAKYDAATEQLESFAENTLLPMLQNASDVFQGQLLDRYDWRTETKGKTKKCKLSALTKAALEKSLDVHADSRIVGFFDPSTLPIMNKLARQRVDMALKLINEGQWSSNAAFKYIGIDTPDDENNELRDRVYRNNNLLPITPESDEAEVSGAPVAEGQDAVERTALNGAQIASLVLIAERVAEGIIPREAGRLFALLSFPLADPGTISEAFSELIEGIAAQKGQPSEPRNPEAETETQDEAEKILREGKTFDRIKALEAQYLAEKAESKPRPALKYETQDLKRASRCIHEMRSVSLKRLANGKTIRIRDLDKALDTIGASDQRAVARRFYGDLSKLLKFADGKQEMLEMVRTYSNSIPRETLKQLASEIYETRKGNQEDDNQDD